MKFSIVICMLLIGSGRSYGQDSFAHAKIQAIARSFSENSRRFTSFSSLPQFVVSYIEQYNGRAFKMSKYKKLSFVAALNNDYILSYDHRGEAHHFHSIIFETNGSEVANAYNIITFDNVKNVTELMEIVESKRYWLRKEHL
jgi:hypothetical protein